MRKVIKLTESDLTRIVKRIIKEQKNNPKRINEMTGLGLLALAGLSLAAPGIYDGARKMWSKYITGRKYQKTGEEIEIAGEVLSEYESRDGEFFWGYDHNYDQDTKGFYTQDEIPSGDIYTAIYREEDLPKLKRFLEEVKKGRKSKEKYYSRELGYGSKEMHLNKPEPVDMIYVKNIDRLD